ncbi:MAG: sulfatase-like hydrolase/transferase, partial [Verrucomicrobiota bacterium]|nr:sulfatase-like hydrolase/transferase [Verrucomicrobiota bacterium]
MFSSFPMNRFLIVIMGALLEWVAGAAAGPPPAPEMANQPNLIVILADDLGYGDLSCYGNQRFETPSLDQMASEGMRFTDFHSSGPVCSPTRAGLLTGRYQQRSGIPGVINAAF